MKKIFLLFIIAQTGLLFAAAQSVVVSNSSSPATDPTATLEVRKPGNSKINVRSSGFAADTAWIQLSNRDAAEQGTDFNIIADREEGLFFKTASDLTAYRNDSLFTMLRNGNIGIGTRAPLSKLDLVGKLRMADGTQGVNKVMVSDANGVASWQTPVNIGFAAIGTYPSAGNFQSIPSGVETKVTIVNNEERDDGNIFNPAISRATVTVAGFYHIDAKIQLFTVSGGLYSMSIKQFFPPTTGFNALRSVDYTLPAGTNQQGQLQISTDAYLPAGTYYEIYLTQYSGSPQQLTGGQYSWFNMHRIY